jgi:hypothetical protein
MPTIRAENEPFACIYCNHDDLHAAIPSQTWPNLISRRVECNKCYGEWVEEFKFVHIYVDDDNYDEIAYTHNLKVTDIDL